MSKNRLPNPAKLSRDSLAEKAGAAGVERRHQRQSPATRSINLNSSASRLIGIWALLAISALGLTVRLTWLQTFAAGDLLKKAQERQTVTVNSFVPRRPIFDRNGNQVAIDRPSYTIYAHPKLFTITAAAMADKLAPILEQDRQKLLNQFNNRKSGIRIGRGLREDIRIRVEALKLAGLEIESTPDGQYTRFYPYNEMLAEVLGYLDLNHKPQGGVEYSQTSLLERKVEGYAITKTARGGILPDRIKPESLYADDLQLKLTIDLRLQRAARKALRQKMQEWNGRNGTVIVMDAETGAVRSLVVEPTYDPNRYFQYVNAVKTGLFNNWAVVTPCEPGSTFKPLNIAIALENGAIAPSSRFYDGGAIKVGIETIKNADKLGNGTIDIAKILQRSSNVGMVKIIQKMQPSVYYNWLQRIGLGHKSGIDLPSPPEAEGLLTNRKEFITNPIYPANTAFGQGISFTPVQLVALTGSLANGGKLVTPYIVEGLFDNNGQQQNKSTRQEPIQIFSPKTAETVLGMMETVVSNPDGSGGKAKIPGYRIGGKTGTAQQSGKNGYKDGRKITSFVGVLPIDRQRRYVVFAAIDNPHGPGRAFGGNVAAPIVKSVMESLIYIEGIPPSGSGKPNKPVGE